MGGKHFILSALFVVVLIIVRFFLLSDQQDNTYDPWADINLDGKVDVSDLAYLAARYGTAGTPERIITPDMIADGALEKSASYIIRMRGSAIEAINGSSGRIDFNGTDGAVIQSVIDAFPSTGGLLFIKDGTYPINTLVTVNKHYVTIVGESRGNTILKLSADIEGLLYVTAATMFTLKDIQLHGNMAERTTGYGIRVNQVSDIFILRCYIHDFEYDGIMFEQTWGAVVEGNYIEANGFAGDYSNLYMYSNENSIVTGNTLAWGKRGMKVLGGSGEAILGCPASNLISENMIFDNNQEGIRFEGDVTQYFIIENFIHGSSRSPTNTYNAVSFAGASATKNIISGNIIDGKYDGTAQTLNGIYFWAGTDNLIEGNIISGVLGRGILEDPNANSDYNTFIGNDLRGCTTKMSLKGPNSIARDNMGYNPVGTITNPYPATTGNLLNSPGVQTYPTSDAVYTVVHSPKTVIVGGGTISAIRINGLVTGLAAGFFKLGVGETIQVTWSVQPTINQVRAE